MRGRRGALGGISRTRSVYWFRIVWEWAASAPSQIYLQSRFCPSFTPEKFRWFVRVVKEVDSNLV
jgi:hypothetical protein